MKVQDRPRETVDRLPELPPDVVVPDDISGLTHPPATRTVGGGIRWFRWLIALFVFAVIAAITTVVVTGGEETETVQQQELSHSIYEGPGSRSWTAAPWLPAPQYGSDRHFQVIPDLRPQVQVVAMSRSMERFGTDNPAFAATLPDTGEYLGLDQLGVAMAPDAGMFTDIYGIDHDPGFALAPPADTGEFLGLDRLDGALFTTDSMTRYGTDNPTFVATVLQGGMVDTGEFLGLDQFGVAEASDAGMYTDIYGVDDDPAFE